MMSTGLGSMKDGEHSQHRSERVDDDGGGGGDLDGVWMHDGIVRALISKSELELRPEGEQWSLEQSDEHEYRATLSDGTILLGVLRKDGKLKWNNGELWVLSEKSFKDLNTYSKGWQMVKDAQLFQNLTNKELRRVEDLIEVKEYVKGDKIFGSSDVADTVYIVDQGVVMGLHPDEVVHVYAGDFFGEISVVSNGPYGFTAMAGSPLVLVAIQTAKLRATMDAHCMKEIETTVQERLDPLQALADSDIIWSWLLCCVTGRKPPEQNGVERPTRSPNTTPRGGDQGPLTPHLAREANSGKGNKDVAVVETEQSFISPRGFTESVPNHRSAEDPLPTPRGFVEAAPKEEQWNAVAALDEHRTPAAAASEQPQVKAVASSSLSPQEKAVPQDSTPKDTVGSPCQSISPSRDAAPSSSTSLSPRTKRVQPRGNDKRIDPTDNQVYSWSQMKSYLKAHGHSKEGSLEYWFEQCRPVPTKSKS